MLKRLAVLPLSILVAQFALAQGGLTGTVHDRSGAALPGVSITVTSNGQARTSVTDASGRFRFLNLPPGLYQVRATQSGFATAVLEHVAVEAGVNAEVSMQLKALPLTAHPRPPGSSMATPPPHPPPMPPTPPPVHVEAESPLPPTPPPTLPPPPPPAAADGDGTPHHVTELYWNRWIEDRQGGHRIDSLPVAPAGPVADLYIDLSTQNLASFDPRNVMGLPAAPSLVKELSTLPPRASLQVLPVVMGEGLELGESGLGWRRVNVDVNKLRGGMPATTEAGPPAAGDAFRAAARAASLLNDPAWDPIMLPVRGVKKGCAAIALSVWEENFDRPLDQRIFPISIGGAPCELAEPSSPSVAHSLLTAYATRAPDYAAALHVFERTLSSGNIATSAVFVRRGEPEPLVWPIGTPLSRIPGLMKTGLDFARTTSPYAFGKATTVLMDSLFNTADPNAAAAWKAMKDLAASGARPVIYARIVTANGDNLPLPLGLIDIGLAAPLGALTTIVSPMPIESFGGDVLPCIDRRVIVTNQPLDPLRPRPGSETTFVGNERARSYFQPLESTDGVALVVFGHHGADERLLFSDESLLMPDVLNRVFTRSVTFLMVCGGAEAGTLSTTWLKKFNQQGIVAAVASPFEIETDRAAEFLRAVHDVLAAVPTNSFVTFNDVYSGAIQNLVDKKDPKAYEAFEYVLVGDGSVRICGEKP